MKNGPLFFLGVFAALALSWAGLALGTNAQLGGLTSYFDKTEDKAFPERPPGIAARGRLVYQDLGCAACHTQQVRRPGFGFDSARKWGERQSVARDYIYQDRVQLGQTRIGPDLTNFGARLEALEKDPAKREQAVYNFLYHGTSAMPAYAFLFDESPAHAQPSPKAVGHEGDREIVPSPRAVVLAAYLLSLKTTYDYPEAKPVVIAAEKPEAHK
jgi:cytochrome c oxidase cbb3-type subunit II